jgi:Spy/CpxP family protein refolding chaperone
MRYGSWNWILRTDGRSRRKIMKGKMLLAFILSFLLIQGSLAAQNSQEQGPARERIRENVYTLRLIRMTQALDLTEEQTSRIYPALGRIEKDKANVQKKIASGLRELKDLLGSPRAGDEELVARVRALQALRKDLRNLDDEFERVLDENLTAVQKANYVIFSVDFYKGLWENLNKARLIRNKRNP